VTTSSRTWHVSRLIAATVRRPEVRHYDPPRPAPRYTEDEPGNIRAPTHDKQTQLNPTGWLMQTWKPASLRRMSSGYTSALSSCE
jgi:hypothetical protein